MINKIRIKKLQVQFCIITILLCMANVTCYANGVTTKILTGTIVDRITMVPIQQQSTIELLDIDSTLVSEGNVTVENIYGKVKTKFNIIVPRPGYYLIKCTNPNYHTLYKKVEIKFYKREESIDIGQLQMKRKLHSDNYTLNEVIVTGTKLKFYFDNDTIIYDAEAFTTQEGFVLNNLLRKMPGIEVKEDGNIYANGKLVDALLLNGKDFFNNDRKTILENLPAFMIKSIKVYDKTKDSLSIIKREREFSGLVVDVKLKKEYSTISLANANLSYGTSNRFYEKLFGLRFNQLKQVNTYAIANNINRNEDLLQNGEVAGNSDDGNGDKFNSKGGISYNFDNSQGKYAIMGNLNLLYKNEKYNQQQNNQQFYKSGDVFSRMLDGSKHRNFQISTEHNLNFFGNTIYDFTIKPSIWYSHKNVTLEQYQAILSQDMANMWGNAWIDSIRSKEIGRIMQLYGINRQQFEGKNIEDDLRIQLSLTKDLNIPHSKDKLRFTLFGTWNENSIKDYNLRQTDYLITAVTDVRNTYQKNYSRQQQFQFTTTYNFYINRKSAIEAIYQFNGISYNANRSLYNLDLLKEWDFERLGDLPTDSLMNSVFNKANSYEYHQTEQNHYAQLKYTLTLWDKGMNKSSFELMIPFNFEHKQLHYFNTALDTVVKRNLLKPDLSAKYHFENETLNERRIYFDLSYKMKHSTPYLLNLVSTRDNSNPTMVRLGNPNLKDMIVHKLDGYIYYRYGHFNYYNLEVMHEIFNNSVSQAVLLDKVTGIYTIMPFNIQGNNQTTGTIRSNFQVGKSHMSSITNVLTITRNKSVEYSGTNVIDGFQQESVHNFGVNENLEFTKSFKDNKAKLNSSAYIIYNHTTSTVATFEKLNCYDFGIKLGNYTELPMNVLFTTDVTGAFRRGYNYSEMNDECFIWNATLSKTFKKITFKLEADDILGQRKNVYRTVTALGRNEILFNNVRRYIMLNLIWRFDKRIQ